MNRFFIPIAVLFLVSLGLAAPVEAGDNDMAMHQLVAAGDLRVEVVELNGYQTIKVKLINASSETIHVDPTGTALDPENDEQPLALTTPAGWKPGRDIEIAPGAEWSGWLRCCCIDEDKEEPTDLAAYRKSTTVAVTTAVFRIMNLWRNNPQATHEAVNQRVWTAQRLAQAIEEVAPTTGATPEATTEQ